MRVIVVGLGVQGNKRQRVAGRDCVGTVDPVNAAADYGDVTDVPADRYDAALICTPDQAKPDLIEGLLRAGKHVLVEKPLIADDMRLVRLAALAQERGLTLYTAYNHRFEPHFMRMGDLLASGALGQLYRCRLFYGNGTARLVRNSPWRDNDLGVLGDLGPHLLDTIAFWFAIQPDDWRVVGADRFENLAFDHVVLASPGSVPRLELEMTLLSWCNSFYCDVFGEHGSAHIRSLCKWGPSRFMRRTRIVPAGRPVEESVELVRDDPTWESEYRHFLALCAGGRPVDLAVDRWINRTLRSLGRTLGVEA